jgi:tripartite-type tricarboxylate transporter receptor subunit TctC
LKDRREEKMRMMTARASWIVAVLCGLLGIVPTTSWAQSWPQRPVRFLIPFGPGAGADIAARLLSERLQARWGKPVVIENRPGGDGLVAIQAFLTANDDHTLLYSPSGNFTVHPFQYEKLPYAPVDLLPIARVSNTVIGVGIPGNMGIATLKDWVDRARAEPGKFNAAVVPGITEFTFDYFVKAAGLSLTKVPYRDIVQAATDVGEGRLQIYMASYAILQPQTQAGRINTIVTTGRERASILPQIPTGIESGFPALEVEGLIGLFGPKGMAIELREKIAADVVAAAKDPVISTRLNSTAQVVNPGGPKELGEAVDRQRAQIAKIAQDLGIKPKQ